MSGKRPGRAAHHRGSYTQQSKLVRAAANADPTTRCAKCGRTLAEAVTLWGHRRARWTAGHINDGEVGGALRPEHHRCNSSAGATYGNQQREPHTESW